MQNCRTPNLIAKAFNQNVSIPLSDLAVKELFLYKGYSYVANTNRFDKWRFPNIVSVKLPFFNFDDGDILNLYLFGENYNLSTSDILSQSNIKKIYKQGIDFLKSQGKSGEAFTVSYQKNNKMEVVYFGESDSDTNQNNLKRIFYKASWFGVSFTWKPAGNGLDILKSAKYYDNPNDNLQDYTDYNLDFYGLARRGSTWKGNRVVRTK